MVLLTITLNILWYDYQNYIWKLTGFQDYNLKEICASGDWEKLKLNSSPILLIKIVVNVDSCDT
jgi:hypothetical protein